MANEKINHALSTDPSNQSFIKTQKELLEFAASKSIDLKVEK